MSRGPRRLGMEALEVRKLLSVSPTMPPAANLTADVAGLNEAPHADISLVRWSHETHFRNAYERDNAATPLQVEESAALETSDSLANDGYLTNEGRPLAVSAGAGVLANDFDVDGDPLTAVLVSGPAHGTLKLAADGSFEYTPEADFNGEDSFAYAANDGRTDGKPATMSITVKPVNDAPVAVDDACSVNEDDTLVVETDDMLANDADVDGDPLSAVLVSSPAHGTLKLAADGSFEYTPEADFNGEDSFAYAANDGRTDGMPATMSITVEPVNDAPVAVDDAYSVDEDDTLVVEADVVLANDADVDADPFSAVLGDGPSDGIETLTPDRSLEHTPEADFSGDDSFRYVADDGQTDGRPATASVEVKDLDLTIRLEVSGTPFGPEAGNAWAGSTFWVNAYVKDLGETAQGVVGGTIDVLFDPASVNAAGSVVYGGALVNRFSLGLGLPQSGPALKAASVDPTYDLNADGPINPLDLDLLMARMDQPVVPDAPTPDSVLAADAAVDSLLGNTPGFASRTEYRFGQNDEIRVIDEMFALNGLGAGV